jgi:opacity protein-like surface antigen
MKLDYRIVCMTLAMCGFSTSALAQDEPVADPVAAEPLPEDPTAGDMGGDMGGDAAPEGDAAPVEDAGDGAEKPISVKLLIGFGLDLEDGSGNPWGLGFGLGGGYNIGQIYLGARFVYYLGESEEQTLPFGAGTVEFSANIWELGVEGGYDVDLGGAVLRPGLGLGLASFNVEAGGMSNSEMYLYVAPGVGAQFDVTDSIFLGAEARFQMVFADPDMVKALLLLASAGMKF